MTEDQDSFDKLKTYLENLKEERNGSLEEYADKIAAGIQIHKIARDAFGEDSMEYAKMEEKSMDENINPRTEILNARREHGKKGIEELETMLFNRIETEWTSSIREEEREADQAKIEIKSRERGRTVETKVRIKLKEVNEAGERNHEKTIYSK